MKTLFAALSIATLAACAHTKTPEAGSSVKDAMSAFWVPAGQSTTAMVSLPMITQAKYLDITTDCDDVEFVKILAVSEIGVGYMSRVDENDSRFWQTPSGMVRNFSAIQFVANNSGEGRYCNYKVGASRGKVSTQPLIVPEN